MRMPTTRCGWMTAGLLVVGMVVGCSDEDSSSPSSGGEGTDVAESDAESEGESDTSTEIDVGEGEDDAGEGEGESPDGDAGDAPEFPDCPEGFACDDEDPCTYQDRCDGNGACLGVSYTCDDGRACTEDLCDGQGGCEFPISAGSCLIGNSCWTDGDVATPPACGECHPPTSQTAWTTDELACDDGDNCTFGDSCVDSVCQGNPVDCDDGETCTADWCDPAVGCVFEPTLADCDDGDACTVQDFCSAEGSCVGATVLDCSDDNPCTADECDEDDGCVFYAVGAACTDGDVCTVGDACVDGVCIPGAPNPCNDGNSCTDDACDSATGCVHTGNDNPCCTGGVNPCDDGNPCTIDLCGGDAEDCFYEPYAAGCSDGDPCTSPDSCVDGECVGSPVDCDDGDPCTLESCVAGSCTATPAEDGTPCDDGEACTTGDQCVAGACAFVDDSECGCTPTVEGAINKVSALSIGESGNPGAGVDVDGDSSTCSPASDCSGGIDNALSVIASFANEPLAEAVAEGDLNLLFEHAGFSGAGSPYSIHFFVANPDPDSTCSPTDAGCDFIVDLAAFDDECAPLITFSGAELTGGTVAAGGTDTVITIPLPIAGLDLEVTLYGARMEATATTSGGAITGLEGVLGGAVLISELKAAIEALPEDTFPPPLDKGTILGFLDLLVTADIDQDGDGTMDAASIGLVFTAVSADVVGFE